MPTPLEVLSQIEADNLRKRREWFTEHVVRPVIQAMIDNGTLPATSFEITYDNPPVVAEPSKVDPLSCIDLTQIPEGWFLWALRDYRTGVIHKGDQHNHQYWRAELQYVKGGRLSTGTGTTPSGALQAAIEYVQHAVTSGRWENYF